MGRGEGNRPCHTTRNDQNNQSKAPYYRYNKYTVEYLEQPPQPALTE